MKIIYCCILLAISFACSSTQTLKLREGNALRVDASDVFGDSAKSNQELIDTCWKSASSYAEVCSDETDWKRPAFYGDDLVEKKQITGLIVEWMLEKKPEVLKQFIVGNGRQVVFIDIFQWNVAGAPLNYLPITKSTAVSTETFESEYIDFCSWSENIKSGDIASACQMETESVVMANFGVSYFDASSGLLIVSINMNHRYFIENNDNPNIGSRYIDNSQPMFNLLFQRKTNGEWAFASETVNDYRFEHTCCLLYGADSELCEKASTEYKQYLLKKENESLYRNSKNYACEKESE